MQCFPYFLFVFKFLRNSFAKPCVRISTVTAVDYSHVPTFFSINPTTSELGFLAFILFLFNSFSLDRFK